MKNLLFLGILFSFFFSKAQVKYIPVVVHVLHQGGYENIADSLIFKGINDLNTAFRKRNADTTDIIPFFKPIAADTEIEFILAQKDPLGNPTNGIVRKFDARTLNGRDHIKHDAWPRDKYLNIWLVKEIVSGSAGYVYFPIHVNNGNCLDKRDGIVMLGNYFNSNYFLINNVASFLDLRLIDFPSSTSPIPPLNCLDNDSVIDTPPVFGFFNQNLCNQNVMSCDSVRPMNLQNYMSINSHLCGKMFTHGQKARMHNTLNSSVAQRNNLWSINNLIETGILPLTSQANYQAGNNPIAKPEADFSAKYRETFVNDTVYFFAKQNNANATATPDAYFWEFEDANPATSTLQNPITFFNSPGFKSVKLTVTNSNGSSVKEIDNYINIHSQNVVFTQQMFENFDGSNNLPNNWAVRNINNDSSSWKINSATSYSGNNCLKLNNFKQINNQNCPEEINLGLDEIILPSIDLSSADKLQFSFKYAITGINEFNENDVLKVSISDNGGKNWRTFVSESFDKSEDLMSDFPINSLNQNQWKTINYSTSNPIFLKPHALIKITFTANAKGNNIFIDDININTPNTTISELNFEENFKIYPNPANDVLNLKALGNTDGFFNYSILDFQGKKVSEGSINLKENTSQNISVQHLNSKSIYFLKIENKEKVWVTKFLIFR